jgi:glycosyltransferase involved in cell wall biosynthesis
VNVLFLTFTYPTPETPAAGIFVKEHARAVAPHANVAVVHLNRGGGSYRIEDVSGEEFRTVRVRYPRSKLAYVRNFTGALAAVRRLRRQGFEPDVIHAHVFLAALPPLFLRPFFRAPVVLTEQWSVFLPEDPATLSAPMRLAARLALRRAAFVLPASRALQRGMEGLGIRARYRVVPNVVDTTLFHPGAATTANEVPRLLFVGLLYEAKGIETMLEAVAQVARRRDVRLDLVGDGPDRPAYELLARDLGIQNIVTFVGLQPKDEVARRMREADLFLMTSRYDNNPCALIEAQASGLPAVATRVGGIPEIVEDGGGLLAEPNDAASVAEAIERALATTFDRSAIAARAEELWSFQAVGRQLLDVYTDALA